MKTTTPVGPTMYFNELKKYHAENPGMAAIIYVRVSSYKQKAQPNNYKKYLLRAFETLNVPVKGVYSEVISGKFDYLDDMIELRESVKHAKIENAVIV